MNELEKLLAEATPLPWRQPTDDDDVDRLLDPQNYVEVSTTAAITAGEGADPIAHVWGFGWSDAILDANAALICAAVNALPELLAKVKRLEEALAFYADPANHIGYPDPNAKVYIETSAIDRDGGNRARALIAGVAIEDRFVQIGWTNEVQIGYVTTDGEGAFYPDSEHDCNVPVYRARAALNQETKP